MISLHDTTILSSRNQFSKDIAEKIPILKDFRFIENDIEQNNTASLLQNNVQEDIQIENTQENTCPICFDSVETNLWITFDCNHSICLSCLEKIYHTQGKKNVLCPLCRKPVETNQNNTNVSVLCDTTGRSNYYNFNNSGNHRSDSTSGTLRRAYCMVCFVLCMIGAIYMNTN